MLTSCVLELNVSQNLVIANKDNKVVFVFGGIDLTLATDIQVEFGSESYSKLLNPLIVIVDSATELSLNLSGTSEVGKVFATVTYKDAGSVYGTDITSRQLGNADRIVVAIGSQLIIEDGTIVANSNSFVTDAEFKAYAGIRNASIPATQPDREALLILAMDYLFNIEVRLSGIRVSDDQELPYPREGACVRDQILPSSGIKSIPKGIKNAQIELAMQAVKSDLLISETSNNLQSISIDGVISESYYQGGSYSIVRTDKADAYLKPFMINGGSKRIMRRI
jgi:hypothetical protein